MANEFTGLNTSALKTHLVYWIYTVSGLETFYVGKKTPTQTNYITLQNILMKKIGRPHQIVSSDGLTTTIGRHQEITVRFTAYGDTCEEYMLEIENSIYGDIWSEYLEVNGLAIATTSSMKISDDFNFTEFIPQAQMDIKFNIFIKSTETSDYISTVEGELEYNADNTDGSSDAETLTFSDDSE